MFYFIFPPCILQMSGNDEWLSLNFVLRAVSCRFLRCCCYMRSLLLALLPLLRRRFMYWAAAVFVVFTAIILLQLFLLQLLLLSLSAVGYTAAVGPCRRVCCTEVNTIIGLTALTLSAFYVLNCCSLCCLYYHYFTATFLSAAAFTVAVCTAADGPCRRVCWTEMEMDLD